MSTRDFVKLVMVGYFLGLVAVGFVVFSDDAEGAEISIGAGIIADNNFDYENGRDDETDATDMHETGYINIQADWTDTVKYGYLHSSHLWDNDPDFGENILYLAYQETLIDAIYVSAAVGIIGNLGKSHKIGLSPRRNNPVMVLTWRMPIHPVVYYRFTYVRSVTRGDDVYSSTYGGIEYKYDI